MCSLSQQRMRFKNNYKASQSAKAGLRTKSASVNKKVQCIEKSG
jgi:hypothetical protein